jgi:3-isopropylmalate/(R)-2-methylmalate dehydratase small subunit
MSTALHQGPAEGGRYNSPRIVSVTGRAIPLVGDDIDTDRIMPARHLRAITFDGLESHVFEDDRKAAEGTHPFDDPRFAGASVMVVNRNFGCGSSREHAPQGLARWGIRAIVGQSFSEIFFGNAVMMGLPAVSAAPADIAALQAAIDRDPNTLVYVNLEEMTAATGDLQFPVTMPDAARQALVSGQWDGLGLLLADYDAVKKHAARLPYLAWQASAASPPR